MWPRISWGQNEDAILIISLTLSLSGSQPLALPQPWTLGAETAAEASWRGTQRSFSSFRLPLPGTVAQAPCALRALDFHPGRHLGSPGHSGASFPLDVTLSLSCSFQDGR